MPSCQKPEDWVVADSSDQQCSASNTNFYSGHPGANPERCWCNLPCPPGQSRYGDGSACQGGGLPTCDLGYCANAPNGNMPSCTTPVDLN